MENRIESLYKLDSRCLLLRLEGNTGCSLLLMTLRRTMEGLDEANEGVLLAMRAREVEVEASLGTISIWFDLCTVFGLRAGVDDEEEGGGRDTMDGLLLLRRRKKGFELRFGGCFWNSSGLVVIRNSARS